MSDKTFCDWILDMLYTVFPPKQNSEIDPIWDMGWKLFIQMSKIWFIYDENAHANSVHNLIWWPMQKLVQSKFKRDIHKGEIKKKERMWRTILFSLFDTLSADKEREKQIPSMKLDGYYSRFWKNIVNTLFYIEELIISYKIACQHDSGNTSPYKTKPADCTFMEEVASSLLDGDFEGSLVESFKKGLFYSAKKKWQDSKLLDTLFIILDPIWWIKAKRRTVNSKKMNSNVK